MFFVPLGLLHPDTMALIDPLEQLHGATSPGLKASMCK